MLKSPVDYVIKAIEAGKKVNTNAVQDPSLSFSYDTWFNQ